MRLIDADELIRQIQLQANRSSLGETAYRELSFGEIAGLIMDAPTVDAEPVRHGKWEPFDYECGGAPDVGYMCSECGRGEGFPHPYCHCGAKMDGE